MIEKLHSYVDSIEDELIELRRLFHKNPELSGKEYGTARVLLKKLDDVGIEAKLLETEAGPGVVAVLGGKSRFPMIAFRADMDALPLQDKKICPYASTVPGVMHACGHDFNMTVITGLARTLATIKDEIEGSVKFIFQPSEESTEGGASYIIKAGAMEDVQAIWTVHALPELPTGKVGIRYGPITSATDAFKITIKGKSGHSARPHNSVDAIYVTTQILNSLYSYVYMKFDPRQPIVLSVGKISGGSAPNIISGEVEFEGTVRVFDQQIRDKIPEIIRDLSTSIASSFGAEIEIDWHFGAPPVVNDEILATITEKCTENILGKESVYLIKHPSMGAEDFSCYLWHAPGMLVRIGTGGENTSYPLHNSMFDIDEKAIGHGVKLLSSVALTYFAEQKMYPSRRPLSRR
jgi:amidohydrolase